MSQVPIRRQVRSQPRDGKSPTPITVIVIGAGLSSVTEVTFVNSKTAVFKAESGTRLTVSVPVGAVSGPIIVRSADTRVHQHALHRHQPGG